MQSAKSHIPLSEEGIRSVDARLSALFGQPPHEQQEGAGFLRRLLDDAAALGHTHRATPSLERAGLPYVKSFEEFDFSLVPAACERQIEELRTFRFVHEAGNVIFLGPPGAGKTHLSVALAERAVRSGIDACYVTAYNLMHDLSEAHGEGRLARQLRTYTAPQLLVIDDIGYVPLDELGSLLFFALVNARHERGSILLTSNKNFREWRTVFGEPVIATAILYRLLPRSTVVNIRCEGYDRRSKQAARSGANPPCEERHPARRAEPHVA